MSSFIRAYCCRANQPIEMVNVLQASEISAVIRDRFTIANEDMQLVSLVTDNGPESLLSEIVGKKVVDSQWRNRLIRLRINGQHEGDFIFFEYL